MLKRTLKLGVLNKNASKKVSLLYKLLGKNEQNSSNQNYNDMVNNFYSKVKKKP